METTNKTVGQIVREDYRAADIFEKFGIDFCCAGKKPLDASCKEKGINTELVANELDRHLNSSVPVTDFNRMTLTELTDYITGTHHAYVQEAIPIMLKYLDKVNTVHSKHNPELSEIYELFRIIAGELSIHMRKEELILFPYIKRLEAGKLHDGGYAPPFASISQPINAMQSDHELEGLRLGHIAELTNKYNPPAHACNTFRVCYAKLQEFEKDLHVHVHLENNILFPKAIELEGAKA